MDKTLLTVGIVSILPITVIVAVYWKQLRQKKEPTWVDRMLLALLVLAVVVLATPSARDWWRRRTARVGGGGIRPIDRW